MHQCPHPVWLGVPRLAQATVLRTPRFPRLWARTGWCRRFRHVRRVPPAPIRAPDRHPPANGRTAIPSCLSRMRCPAVSQPPNCHHRFRVQAAIEIPTLNLPAAVSYPMPLRWANCGFMRFRKAQTGTARPSNWISEQRNACVPPFRTRQPKGSPEVPMKNRPHN